MAGLIIQYLIGTATIILVAALGGTLCFLVLSVLKMFIDELRGE